MPRMQTTEKVKTMLRKTVTELPRQKQTDKPAAKARLARRPSTETGKLAGGARAKAKMDARLKNAAREAWQTMGED